MNMNFVKVSILLIIAALLAGCAGAIPVGSGGNVNGTPVPPGQFVWEFQTLPAGSVTPVTPAPTSGQSTWGFTPTPGTVPSITPTPIVPTNGAPATGTPVSAISTQNFGEGTCTSNGQVYSFVADPSAVWNDEATLKSLASYGGLCQATTVTPGWFWAISASRVTYNGQEIPAGNQVVANPGVWEFEFAAPANGTPNESVGVMFRDNIPNAPASGSFAIGNCSVDGATIAVFSNDHATWENDTLIQLLFEKGGICSVVTLKDGYYWSTAGVISFNGNPMPNGQGLEAPSGTWVFTYLPGNTANGFIIRDSALGQ